MNKKALSLLLAVSMVFSMNAVAFADEANDEVVAIEDVVEVEDEAEATQSTDSMNSQTVSQVTLTDGSVVSYNKTPLFTGAKIDAKALNMKVTVSGLSVSKNLTVEKLKFAKGYKKTTTGTVKVGVAKFNKTEVKALSKADKKVVKSFIKTSKKTPSIEIEIGKFSVSYNDVEAQLTKKVTAFNSSSSNYAISAKINKKNTKATVFVWYKNSKGKLKKAKVNKSNVSYSNNTIKLSGNYEGTLIVSGNSLTVSGN